jgi:hypothetical protein
LIQNCSGAPAAAAAEGVENSSTHETCGGVFACGDGGAGERGAGTRGARRRTGGGAGGGGGGGGAGPRRGAAGRDDAREAERSAQRERALPHRPQSLKIQLRRLTERSHTALETQWFEVAAHIAAIVSAAILSV